MVLADSVDSVEAVCAPDVTGLANAASRDGDIDAVGDDSSSLIGEKRRDAAADIERPGAMPIITRSLIFSFTASFSLLKCSKSGAGTFCRAASFEEC